MTIRSLDHINIYTKKLDETVRFYEKILGLKKGPRPAISIPGAWIYCNDVAVIHLMELEPKGQGTGVVDHVAMGAEDIQGFIQRAREAGLDYRVQDVPDFHIRQLFLRDPNGVQFELNFVNPADVEADIQAEVLA